MRCEECKKAKASFHVTDLSGGKQVERHLCQACAQKLGLAFPGAVSLETLSELLSQATGKAEEAAEEEGPDITCEVCGMSVSEFQKEGRLGCPNDYAAFSEQIAPLIERIHDRTSHVGKVPRAAGAAVKAQVEVRALRARLQRAVNDEDYEEAARLRDELSKRLDGKEGSSS